MRVLVSEYVCGGGWSSGTRPESLVREGRAMLLGLATDLAGLPDVKVVTTWDRGLGESPFVGQTRVSVAECEGPESEEQHLRSLAAQSDWGIVIAPEFNGILERRCRFFRDLGLPLANPSPEAISLCADKWALFERLIEWGIQTIETQLPSEQLAWPRSVVKVRDGAGSIEMDVLSSQEDYEHWLKAKARDSFIIQPLVEGRPVSVAGIYDKGELCRLLPITEQRLTDDGHYHYLGGSTPLRDIGSPLRCRIQNLILKISSYIEGLHGYVGFDLIIDESGKVLLVEVNPRLTSSSIGYRTLLGNRVAETLYWIMTGDGHHPPGTDPESWFDDRFIRFHADGTVEEVGQ